MVRALLDGSKTQTRRVMKPQPIADAKYLGGHYIPASKRTKGASISIEAPYIGMACPYSQPGDQLWVREAFRTETAFDNIKPSLLPVASRGKTLVIPFWRDADLTLPIVGIPGLTPGKYRPGMFMPRVISRITLKITGVRVERLQDISESDAITEGIETLRYGGLTTYRDYSLTDEWAEVSPMLESPIESYRTLWESINGPGSWDANPWVWVVEFKRIEQ